VKQRRLTHLLRFLDEIRVALRSILGVQKHWKQDDRPDPDEKESRTHACDSSMLKPACEIFR
jgi:hypothetical protein